MGRRVSQASEAFRRCAQSCLVQGRSSSAPPRPFRFCYYSASSTSILHEDSPRGSKPMLDVHRAKPRLKNCRRGAWLVSPFTEWKWAKWPDGEVGWIPASTYRSRSVSTPPSEKPTLIETASPATRIQTDRAMPSVAGSAPPSSPSGVILMPCTQAYVWLSGDRTV
jgi:hypothetical protein